jgi:hypothetical protein
MGMRANWRIPGLTVLVAALAAGAAGAQNHGPTKDRSTTSAAGTEPRLGKVPAKKIEKLACALGTQDNHARIAVELVNGKVNRFAYYSIWKPRTCSMEVERGDIYSRWEDTGSVTVVTLSEDTGAFLIGHEAGKRFHFIFRDIDRVRYCGMEGKVSGSLTIARGEPRCVLDGVMEKGE